MGVVNEYDIRFNSDRIAQLIKERSVEYETGGNKGRMTIDTPEKAAMIIESLWDASNLAQEKFWVLALDGARKVAGAFEVTTGTLMASLVHPREVFQRAFLAGAASIIISHNHPSGALVVSESDNEVTKRISKSGEILGIKLDDHILIANGNFASIHGHGDGYDCGCGTPIPKIVTKTSLFQTLTDSKRAADNHNKGVANKSTSFNKESELK